LEYEKYKLGSGYIQQQIRDNKLKELGI